MRRRRIDWSEGLAIGAGECLFWVALWAVGGIGFVIATAFIAGASRWPAIFAPIIAAFLAVVCWGAVLTVQHRPGLYLEHLDEDRRSALGSGWIRRTRLIAMASLQFTLVAIVGYIAWVVMFD